VRVSAGSVAAEPEGESKMNSSYVKLPDWQMGLSWLAVTAIATVDLFRSNGTSRRSCDQLGWQVHRMPPELRALLGFGLKDCQNGFARPGIFGQATRPYRV
jgi:hypothetical protein